MPFSHNAIECPAALSQALGDASVTLGADGSRCLRVDIDVDGDTLLQLNEFEARARHRQVRLRPAGRPDCVVGEMNTIIGLGPATDPTRHVGKVRISFHDLQWDDCVDPAAEARRSAAIEAQRSAAPAGVAGAVPRSRKQAMKNPWLSLWLSAANSWAGAARGLWTAEMGRQRKAVASGGQKRTPSRSAGGSAAKRKPGTRAPRKTRS